MSNACEHGRYDKGYCSDCTIDRMRLDVIDLMKERDMLRDALEYQALVNHGYSELAQKALDGTPLDEGQITFINWARTQTKE